MSCELDDLWALLTDPDRQEEAWLSGAYQHYTTPEWRARYAITADLMQASFSWMSPMRHVLDLGCGTMLLAHYLTPQWTYTGIEKCQTPLNNAMWPPVEQRPEMKVHHCDFMAAPLFAQTQDWIVWMGAHPNFIDVSNFKDYVLPALQFGGRLLIESNARSAKAMREYAEGFKLWTEIHYRIETDNNFRNTGRRVYRVYERVNG